MDLSGTVHGQTSVLTGPSYPLILMFFVTLVPPQPNLILSFPCLWFLPKISIISIQSQDYLSMCPTPLVAVTPSVGKVMVGELLLTSLLGFHTWTMCSLSCDSPVSSQVRMHLFPDEVIGILLHAIVPVCCFLCKDEPFVT